ncbi:prepilin-type N-terminal cleavage/methylation domain-containing protein [Noviherbaspirillum sp. DKR-6]|uniref:Prepilin-type N-terminal cleavage/methylation domain-containing protein n=2 Tax=Noviherbaspirillum pedocola TaxID=2801341 RepID=A0A934W688_9BURK|nr:prepilin-type N-terminal cleavage/methylation domain-containing protein [Noviherbaspirillum pedocola]
MPTKHARSRGVTLVELVVAMLIVAVLAAIAFPSYQNYAKRARRSAAQAYLLDLAQRQQDYLLNARAYAGSVSLLNSPAPQTVSPYYTVSLTTSAGPPAGFTITAAPVSGTAQAGDVTLTVDGTGAKTPSGVW